jgi:hypothetical protein
MEDGRYEQAVDLFTRAEALVHAPPHLVYVARAYVKLGKFVRAREAYLKVTRETLASTAPKAFAEAQALANDELQALEARIPNVKIEVEGGPSNQPQDLVVTMDGLEVPKALVGISHPVDPGDHVFVAKADGFASDPITKSIAERTQEAVRLTLKPSADANPTVTASTPESPQPTKNAPAEKGSSGLRTGAYVAWGVGVAGLAAGTVFLLQNRSAREEADALCPNGRCPASQRDVVNGHSDDAASAATLSWIGYGVGVAAVAAGTVMFVMSSGDKALVGGGSGSAGGGKRDKKAAAPASGRVTLRPIVGLSSLGLKGEF